MIDDILKYNKEFVNNKAYESYRTSKYPDKKLAIISCMDTRLTELLPAALGLKNGDAKIIKNAGGMISHPFGSAVRSLLIGIAELGVEEIMVIGHTDCGVRGMNPEKMLECLTAMGVPKSNIDMLRNSGIGLDTWLRGFDTVEAAVHDTVKLLKCHPLMPGNIVIQGFVINTETGGLKAVVGESYRSPHP